MILRHPLLMKFDKGQSQENPAAIVISSRQPKRSLADNLHPSDEGQNGRAGNSSGVRP
jgi:hypothetical protein